MGGGTSMSYKFFALFGQGIKKAQSSLRSGAHNDALCEVIVLTQTMLAFDDWWCDTDAPEEAARLVKKLAAVWGEVLASYTEPLDLDTLMSWLAIAQQTWEGEAADHLGTKLTFNVCTHVKTPKKGASEQIEGQSVSGVKTRKLPPGHAGEPAKKRRGYTAR